MASILLVVDSMTGQGKRFAEKLGYPVVEIAEASPREEDHVVLVTRSYNFGQIPDTTLAFIHIYQHQIIGVAVGGNRTWGQNFGAAGDKIQHQFGIPLIQKFEGTGFPNEVNQTKKWIDAYANRLSTSS